MILTPSEASGSRKESANLIMGDVFGKPAIVTDTPLHPAGEPDRPGGRDQRAEESGDGALEDHSPGEGGDLCHRLVYHGQDVCTARTKPHCDKCCLADICKKKRRIKNAGNKNIKK